MAVRQWVDYNYGGGKYPGYLNCPPGLKAPAMDVLGPGYDYFYQYYGSNPYRPDSMVVVDEDPDPTNTRFIIGWTFPGDWWRYTFDVPTNGWVKLALRAASPGVTTFNIYWDEQLAATATGHTGSWGVFDDFPATDSFYATAGRHTLRLQLADGSANLSLFGYDFAAAPPSRRTIFRENFEGYADTDSLRTNGGWTIVNGSGAPEVAWSIQNTQTEPRTGLFTGMNGYYLITDSGNGPRARATESLISPMIDCRNFSAVILRFSHNALFNTSSGSAQNLELALDLFDESAGAWPGNWTPVYHHARDDGNVTEREWIDLSQWADGRRMRLRWRFADANWDYWWALDNVEVTGKNPAALGAPGVASLAIDFSATAATDRMVRVQATVTGNPSFIILSERADFAGAQWQPYAVVLPFQLSPGDGSKTIYAKAKNGAGSSTAISASIVVSPTGPTLTAARTLSSGVSFPPGLMEIAVQIDHHGSEPVPAVELDESLPVGWIFDSVVSGPTPSVSPTSKQIGNLVFRWEKPAVFPFTLIYRVSFAGPSYGQGTVTGQVRLRNGDSTLDFPTSGSSSPSDARTDDHTFHRILYHGTVLSTEEWDWVAQAGFTIVHSYGSDPAYFRWMLDEAHKRGLKMIGGAQYPFIAAWLTLEVDASVPRAPTELWPHVVHHFSSAGPKIPVHQ